MSNSTDKSLVSFINQQRYTSGASAKPVSYKQPQDEPKGVLASYLAPQDKKIQSSFKPVFEDKKVKVESGIERPSQIKYVNPRKHDILNKSDDNPAKLSKLEELYAQTVNSAPV